jgi:hypothetical protein
MSTKFIIEIDDFFFRIMNKNLSESREIVNIYSSKEKDELTKEELDETKITKFSVYLSISELGCFRLCLLGDPGPKPEPGQQRSGDYVKGIVDYIQQTFIHIELQKFIHNNYKQLEITDRIDFCNCNDQDICLYIPILSHINNNDRIERLEPFLNYDKKFKCGHEINSTETVINNSLKEFSNLLENKYTCSQKDNIEIFIHTINDAVNDYILEYYKINLIEIDKDKNNTDTNILLYYYIVNIKKFNNKELPKEKIFYVPLFLTTNNHKITIFGTSDKYIIAGNYICKMFDYLTQCSKDIKSDTYRCFGNYVLIGNRYDDIFPFNKIKNFNIYTKTDTETETDINTKTNYIKRNDINNNITIHNQILYKNLKN